MEQHLEFIDTKSHIQNINASIKILYLILYVAICIVATKYYYLFIANFILVLFLLISSKIPLKYYLKNVCKFWLIIVALYIIFASFSFTFIYSTLIVLAFIFGICLYSMIIYSTHPFYLALGIYDFVKYFNILSINRNWLFIHIYNFVYLKKDYTIASSNVIDALELKGANIRHKNIIARFLIKTNFLNDTLLKIKKIRKKRIRVMEINNFDVKHLKASLAFVDLIYLLLFVLLIAIYLCKVV